MESPISVLLVEAERDYQDTFIAAIRGLPEIILFNLAANGKEALALLNKSVEIPDLIFMNLSLPIMDGFSCLKILQKHSRLKEVPVIILSDAGNMRAHAMSSGAKGFIQKTTCGQHVLRESIKQAISCVLLPTIRSAGNSTESLVEPVHLPSS